MLLCRRVFALYLWSVTDVVILEFVPPLTFYSTSKVSFNECIHQHLTVFVIGWNHSTAWQLSQGRARKILPCFFHCKKWRARVWLHFPLTVQKHARYWGVCIPLRHERLLCESCDGLMTCPGCNPACLLAKTDSNPLINLSYQMEKKKKVLNFSRFKKNNKKTLSYIQYVFFFDRHNRVKRVPLRRQCVCKKWTRF